MYKNRMQVGKDFNSHIFLQHNIVFIVIEDVHACDNFCLHFELLRQISLQFIKLSLKRVTQNLRTCIDLVLLNSINTILALYRVLEHYVDIF